MKAITLWEPWATLVAMGLKRYETRSWATHHRGALAIHAAKRKVDISMVWTIQRYIEQQGLDVTLPRSYPYGHVLAVVNLHAVFGTEHIDPGALERLVGDFSPGRYAWKFRNIRALPVAIPARGAQGLWEWRYDGELPLEPWLFQTLK